MWHLSGLAMRQCLELGLHRQRSVTVQNFKEDQRRKRLFWSLYIFDRKTALILGRPFSVSEKEIEVDLPADMSYAPLASGHNHPFPPTTWSLHMHRSLIKLYHIHTKIRLTITRLRKLDSDEARQQKITLRFDELDDWHQSAVEEHSFSMDSSVEASQKRKLELAEIELEYHKAQRSLLQPLLTDPDNSTLRLHTIEYAACADSAGQICQLYRRLHRLSALPFTLRDLHAVFVAGFTIIYCICAKPTLYDARRATDIGACSTVLYVITEQWPSARQYRDAFEVVAERMVNQTQQKLESLASSDVRRSDNRTGECSYNFDAFENAKPTTEPPSRVSQATSATSETPLDDDVVEPWTGIRLDLASEYEKLGDLLAEQGIDWFADFAFDDGLNAGG